MKKVLVLLGCPESPSQTPMAIYTSYKLSKLGFDVTIAVNPAAVKLLRVSDPENIYVKKMVNIDHCLNDLEEGQFDLLVGFVHKDAAASFFVTFYQILQIPAIALVFERDMELLEEFTNIVKENTGAKIISVKAFHNPNPIKVQFDKILEEL